jgi:hypothetical protein
MKPYGRVEVEIHALLISASDRGEWLVLRSGRFAPEDKESLTRWGWTQSRSRLCGGEKIPVLVGCQTPSLR